MDLTNTAVLKLPLPSAIPTARLVPQEWQDTLEEKLYAARVWMRERGLRDGETPALPVQEVPMLEEPAEISVRRVA
jgi:hypothetical protein